MATQTFYAKQSAIISLQSENYNDHAASEVTLRQTPLLAAFNTAAASNLFNVITNIALDVYLVNKQDDFWYIGYRPLTADFDEETVTYKTAPQTYSNDTYYVEESYAAGQYFEVPNVNRDGLAAGHIVRHGLMISGNYTTIQTSHGINKPYSVWPNFADKIAAIT